MKRCCCLLSCLVLLLFVTGCGAFMAHRMIEAPNRYPNWLHPEPRVTLGFGPKFLTNFPSGYVNVGPPAAKLFYRVVSPAQFQLQVTSTNRIKHGHKKYDFNFKAVIPAQRNRWTGTPRGTVVLLHGYGMAQFAMAPWAIRLAEDGWRCVLVDLRGHGKSTGKRIFYGLREVNDLKQLFDALDKSGDLRGPVSVMGESYGAALALRWKAQDPRIDAVIAIAPYGSLSNATMSICHEYAPWVPLSFFRAGLRELPELLHVQPKELDTTTVLERHPVAALFIAGEEDGVAPPAVVKQLAALAPGSKFILVPKATHEAVPYFFDDLTGPVEKWLEP